MKNNIFLLPTILFTLFATGCNKNKENEYKPEWYKHPHDVLYFIEQARSKVKMTGHKLTSFDENLSIRNSIMDIPYDEYKSADKDIEKSNKSLEYTVCFGEQINDVLAEMTFYDNGSLMMVDCYKRSYFYNIDKEKVATVFATAEKEFATLENDKPDDKKLAEEACDFDKFINNCKEDNASREEDKSISFHFLEYSTKDNFISFGYSFYDQNNRVLNELGKANVEKESSEDAKTIKEELDLFSYRPNRDYCCYMPSNQSFTCFKIYKLYGDHSKGEFRYHLTTYKISEDKGKAFYDAVGKITADIYRSLAKGQ